MQDGGELIAERFAGASGHDEAGVTASGDTADNGFLAGAEGVIAPELFEGEGEGVGLRSSRGNKFSLGVSVS